MPSNESRVQSAICEYLTLKKHFFWRVNNIPRYDKQRGIFFKLPKYTPQGLPDITVITEGGFAVFLEVKDKGKQSPMQKEFEEKCKDKGCEYHVVRSIEDVVEIGL